MNKSMNEMTQEELYQIAKTADNMFVREEATKNITNQEMLIDLFNDNITVEAAVKNITDQDFLLDLLKNDDRSYVKDAAGSVIADEEVLIDIAKNYEVPNMPNWRWGIVRGAAIYGITDQFALAEIAMEYARVVNMIHSEYLYVCLNAIERITDQGVLTNILKIASHQMILDKAAECIKDQATLINIAKTDSDEDVRVAAIRAITGIVKQDVLIDIARTDKEEFVRFTAVEGITDEAILHEFAKTDKSKDICALATESIKNQSFLIDIVKTAKVAKARVEAAYRIKDKTILAEIACTDKDKKVRKAALCNIVDQAILSKIAKTDSDKYVRKAAIEKITDQSVLIDIAKTDEEEQVRKEAMKRIKDKVILAEIKGNGKNTDKYLDFDNFNFKLAIIQELMYNQEVLTPKFDVYEFFDHDYIEENGYEEFPEVRDFFEELKIDKSLTKYVKELSTDAGDDIYAQIFAFWDGEDEIYDLTEISEDEIAQFPNLKNISNWCEVSKEALLVLKKQGVKFSCWTSSSVVSDDLIDINLEKNGISINNVFTDKPTLAFLKEVLGDVSFTIKYENGDFKFRWDDKGITAHVKKDGVVRFLNLYLDLDGYDDDIYYPKSEFNGTLSFEKKPFIESIPQEKFESYLYLDIDKIKFGNCELIAKFTNELREKLSPLNGTLDGNEKAEIIRNARVPFKMIEIKIETEKDNMEIPINSIKRYFEKLQTFDGDWQKSKFFPPVSVEQINLFEKEQNIKIPESYKEWLQLSNGGSLFGGDVQLYGIDNPPKPPIGYDSSDGMVSKEYLILGRMGSEHICYNPTIKKFFFYEYQELEEDDELKSFEEVLDYIIDIYTS